MIFERPEALFLLTAIPPAVVCVFVHIRKIMRLAATDSGCKVKVLKLRLRTVLWALAWLCAVIALGGPAWGIKAVPVERSGNAVCFVFDISYSMMAQDAGGKEKLSRLEMSKQLALSLLRHLRGASAAAVLAKGDGVLALPLTEDYRALENLISVLSPTMFSAPGSAVSAGIERALQTFPPQSARNSFIIVFTDGDETEGNIARAASRAGSYGVQVFLVGTGSESETEILAGDGKTPVKTALRKAKLEKAAEFDTVHYIAASDTNTVDFIVNTIEALSPSFSAAKSFAGAYEMQKAKHHAWFLLLSLVFFLTGFACVQIKFFGKIPVLFVFVLLGLTSCSAWKDGGAEVLLGSYYWAHQDYQKASAAFLTAAGHPKARQNAELLQYALFGLGSSYLMQDEDAAALAKFDEIVHDAPAALLYALWYNKGIIAYRTGNFLVAADCFKNALSVDSSNLDAKINLELCLQQKDLRIKPTIQELIPAETRNAPPGAEDAVFSLIKENDTKQWKNKYVESFQNDVIDF